MVEFLCLLLTGVGGYALWLRRERARLQLAARGLQVDNKALQAIVDRYRPVMDAEAYAARLRIDVDREAASLLKSSTEQLRKADQRVGEASQQADAIIANASRRAEEIAGEA